ncbi:MAG: hypothetical protein ACREFR_18395, partial [Limisphaerales bacterium]
MFMAFYRAVSLTILDGLENTRIAATAASGASQFLDRSKWRLSGKSRCQRLFRQKVSKQSKVSSPWRLQYWPGRVKRHWALQSQLPFPLRLEQRTMHTLEILICRIPNFLAEGFQGYAFTEIILLMHG